MLKKMLYIIDINTTKINFYKSLKTLLEIKIKIKLRLKDKFLMNKYFWYFYNKLINILRIFF
jgi:hypothetical protein